MSDIFISFIHEDVKIATAVQRLIQDQLSTRSVFLSSDPWQVFAGEVWLDRIRLELDPAKVVVMLLTSESVKRPWINFEAGAAWLRGKAIIPVCYAGLSKSHLPKPYSNFQALDLRTEAYYLVSSVAHHLDILALPPWLNTGKECSVLMAELDQVEGA